MTPSDRIAHHAAQLAEALAEYAKANGRDWTIEVRSDSDNHTLRPVRRQAA